MRKQDIDNLVNNCILQSSVVDNLGIFTGKTKMIIFMFHYSLYCKKKLYADFAEVLLDDIFEDIHNNKLINISNGILGIGWGIEYILKNNFVSGNAYEVLEDIDKQLMSWDIKRIEDESLETGLEGFFHYILYHLPSNKTMQCPFDSQYLNDLEIVANKKKHQCSNMELQRQSLIFIEWLKGSDIIYDPYILMKRIQYIGFEQDKDKKKLISTELYNNSAKIDLLFREILKI